MNRWTDRVCIVGTSCSGKSTLARALAQALQQPHVELDSLAHLPGWQQRPKDEFSELLAERLAGPRWVCCGNYISWAGGLQFDRATAVLWLDYPLPRVFARALRRTIHRAWTKQPVCNGNTESFRQSFASRDSILWWVVKTHRKNRRRYEQLHHQWVEQRPDLRALRIRSPREADELFRASLVQA